MRFVNCSNCFSSHSDDSEQPTGTLKRASRSLHVLTKAIFLRQTNNKSSSQNNEGKSLKNGYRPFPIERKHKLKKRDLVRQLVMVDTATEAGIKYFFFSFFFV